VTLPRLRAPAQNGAVLAHPPLAEVGALIDRNRHSFADSERLIGGVCLCELRRRVVAEVNAEARAYLHAGGEPLPELNDSSLFVAGHQPELFHPGVWLKNFALNALAKRHGATPLNLVVDNDISKSVVVRVPHNGAKGDPTTVRLTSVPFDHLGDEVAFEERAVRDEAVFADFPQRVAEVTRDWPFEPVSRAFWDDVLRQGGRTPLMGERFAAARRIWERRWGCHNLELPLSRLCRTAAFARFAIDLIDGLPAFHHTYNDCVRDYRRRHGIRSRNHPVPDLGRDGDWLEAPFWAWRDGERRRSRLFARPTAGGWQLRAGSEAWPDLPRAGAVDRWRQLEGDGYKVRTRALTTTFFARLLFADLFIHGIGGGRYDEITDAILARHFGVEPPRYLVLTGTLHLPLPTFAATEGELRRERRRVRDVYWNPQRHLPDGVKARPEVQTVLADRARLIAWRPSGPDDRLARYHQLREAADRLRGSVADVEAQAMGEAEQAAAEVAANDILRRRDYAFCLFPESQLKAFCVNPALA
jgi:hypothetical protein